MSVYLIPITAAMLIFPFLAALLWQYPLFACLDYLFFYLLSTLCVFLSKPSFTTY